MRVATITNIFMKTYYYRVYGSYHKVCMNEHASKENFLFRWNFVISCGIIAMKVPYSMLDENKGRGYYLVCICAMQLVSY